MIRTQLLLLEIVKLDRELRLIGRCTSPRDKLICISNCFRIINSKLYEEIISNAHQGTSVHGADDSLPLFVYVLLKAKVPKLFSNFYFIKNYRYKPRREYRDPVEFKYTFTSLKIALRFILEIKSSKLHLQADESFKELVKLSKKKTQGTQTSVGDKPFRELELREMFSPAYTGEISAGHFISNPQELELFISDYFALLNIKKE